MTDRIIKITKNKHTKYDGYDIEWPGGKSTGSYDHSAVLCKLLEYATGPISKNHKSKLKIEVSHEAKSSLDSLIKISISDLEILINERDNLTKIIKQ